MFEHLWLRHVFFPTWPEVDKQGQDDGLRIGKCNRHASLLARASLLVVGARIDTEMEDSNLANKLI